MFTYAVTLLLSAACVAHNLDEIEKFDYNDAIYKDKAIESQVRYLDTARQALLEFAAKLRKGMNITNAYLKVIDGFEKNIANLQATLEPRKISPILIKNVKKFIKEASKDRKANTAILRILTARGLFLAQKLTKKSIKAIRKRDYSDLFQGALVFLESIKNDIGDTAFEQYLSVSGLVTLIFAIDDTGSMLEDIKAANAIATQIVRAKRDYDVDYILSPFNDPSMESMLIYKC